mgnify:CR=1 FL=1
MSSSYFDRNICLLTVQRGVGAVPIFADPLEYKIFLKLLRRYKGIYCVRIFAFCLLPSAVYLVAGADDTHVVSQFLEKVNQDFCDFIRVRDGSQRCLQIGRSRIVVIEDDRALADIVAFVDSFPVRRGLVRREEDYEWSSFCFRAFGINNGMLEKLDVCL